MIKACLVTITCGLNIVLLKFGGLVLIISNNINKLSNFTRSYYAIFVDEKVRQKIDLEVAQLVCIWVIDLRFKSRTPGSKDHTPFTLVLNPVCSEAMKCSIKCQVVHKPTQVVYTIVQV